MVKSNGTHGKVLSQEILSWNIKALTLTVRLIYVINFIINAYTFRLVFDFLAMKKAISNRRFTTGTFWCGRLTGVNFLRVTQDALSHYVTRHYLSVYCRGLKHCICNKHIPELKNTRNLFVINMVQNLSMDNRREHWYFWLFTYLFT